MPDYINLIFYFVTLLVSFGCLHFISKYYFIDSLDLIVKRFKIPSDIAGSTLMAAGSSAPELAVVVIAIMKSGHHEEIGVGTIVGSALFNILIIVGAVILVKRSKLVWQPLLRDFTFYSISILLIYLFFQDGNISLHESLSLVLVYAIYIAVMYYWKKLFPYKDIEKYPLFKQHTDTAHSSLIKQFSEWLKKRLPKIQNYYRTFILSIIFISLLCWVLVECAIKIAEILGIPEVIVGLTILAVGTSIPDLVASIIVAKQGRTGMAINNAIGSNIFDILIGLGLPWLVLLLFTPKTLVVNNENLTISMSLLAGTMAFLLISFVVTKWKTRKLIGGFLISLYLLYLISEIYKVI